jgi:hypothetical protein
MTDQDARVPSFTMKQRPAHHLPPRLIALTFGVIFIWRAWFAGVERGEFEPLYAGGFTLGAIFLFLVYFFFPIGFVEADEERIRIATFRLFGQIRREAGEARFDQMRRLETQRAPLSFFGKQVIVVICVAGGEFTFDASYGMEDRKRLTRLLQKRSGLYDFEVIDNVRLLND